MIVETHSDEIMLRDIQKSITDMSSKIVDLESTVNGKLERLNEVYSEIDDKLAQKLSDQKLKEEPWDADKKLTSIFKTYPMKVIWGQKKEDFISHELSSPDMIL